MSSKSTSSPSGSLGAEILGMERRGRRTRRSCRSSTTGSSRGRRPGSSRPRSARRRRSSAWLKKEKSAKRRRRKKRRRGKKKRRGRRRQLQTCLFTTVDTWLELKRTNQTRGKLTVRSKRNGLLRIRRHSTSTILELTDFARKPKNCGKNFTDTKNRNTTLNKELLARNTIATSSVNVSMSTWASLTRTRAR